MNFVYAFGGASRGSGPLLAIIVGWILIFLSILIAVSPFSSRSLSRLRTRTPAASAPSAAGMGIVFALIFFIIGNGSIINARADSVAQISAQTIAASIFFVALIAGIIRYNAKK